MQDRHAAIAAACLDRVAQRLETLDPNALRPSDVARLLEVASRAERMARGVLADEPSVQERGWTISAGDLRRKLKEGGLWSEFMNPAAPEPDVATAESRPESWSWSTENEPET